jgi:hypothetical protein
MISPAKIKKGYTVSIVIGSFHAKLSQKVVEAFSFDTENFR